MTTQRIALAVSPYLIYIQIAFVGRDHDHNAGFLKCSDSIHYVDAAHHICVERFNRFCIGSPDKRLCCEMEDNIRLYFVYVFSQLLFISDVCKTLAFQKIADMCCTVVVWLCVWGESVPVYVCSKL